MLLRESDDNVPDIGPTGQVALPADVPVLAVEHDEDLVPVLGGTAASGAAGLQRVLVRRSLPDGGFHPVSTTTTLTSHDFLRCGTRGGHGSTRPVSWGSMAGHNAPGPPGLTWTQ